MGGRVRQGEEEECKEEGEGGERGREGGGKRAVGVEGRKRKWDRGGKEEEMKRWRGRGE